MVSLTAGLMVSGAPALASCVEADLWVSWSGGQPDTKVTPWAPDSCVVWTPLPPGAHLWGGHASEDVPDGVVNGYRYDINFPAEPSSP